MHKKLQTKHQLTVWREVKHRQPNNVAQKIRVQRFLRGRVVDDMYVFTLSFQIIKFLCSFRVRGPCRGNFESILTFQKVTKIAIWGLIIPKKERNLKKSKERVKTYRQATACFLTNLCIVSIKSKLLGCRRFTFLHTVN